MEDPKQRFTTRAADYAIARPAYPAEAIDALLDGLGPPGTLCVVDLGAGTGIASRLLAERDAHVIAIEPNDAMRAQAPQHDSISWRARSAEDTGLEPASANLVAAFQAFHWFNAAATLREIERILRPRGRAAVVYNERDERDAFTTAYGDLVRIYSTDDTERRRTDGCAAFAANLSWIDVRHLSVASAQRLDRTRLHARANSTSYLPKTGPRANDLHRALDALFGTYADRDEVVIQMQTQLTIAQSP